MNKENSTGITVEQANELREKCKEAINLASDKERIDLDKSYKYHIKESNDTVTLKDILQKTFSEYSSFSFYITSLMLSCGIKVYRKEWIKGRYIIYLEGSIIDNCNEEVNLTEEDYLSKNWYFKYE